MAKIIQKVILWLIQVYRLCISGFLGHCCRFEPSCSRYAEVAIKRHGLSKGCYFAMSRVLRCHPWHAGGIDPVPELRT
jgi:uncharacterized protein